MRPYNPVMHYDIYVCIVISEMNMKDRNSSFVSFPAQIMETGIILKHCIFMVFLVMLILNIMTGNY